MDGSDDANRRRFSRETLTVRTLLKSKDEADWTPVPIVDVSGGGLAVRAELPEPVGAVVQVQIDRIGGAPARIVRKGNGVTALEMLDEEADTRHRRVEWHAGDEPNRRTHQRARPQPKGDKQIFAPVEFPDGKRTYGRVLDVSAGGIQLTDVTVEAGMRLAVGGIAGQVVRAGNTSVAISFAEQTDLRRIRLVTAKPAAGGTRDQGQGSGQGAD